MARVLLVDDEADIRRFVVRLLAAAGHEVSEAADAREALDALAAEPAPDAVVLDLGLPGGDGLGVLAARRERRLAPAARVLVLTARAGELDHLRAYDLDADDYLTKPFAGADLVARLAWLLAAGRQEIEERRVAERDKAAFLNRVEAAFEDPPAGP